MSKRIPVYPEGRTKACPDCQRVLPWQDFPPSNFHVGTPRVKTVRPRCRECQSAKEKRERLRGNARLPIEPWREWLHARSAEYGDDERLAADLGVWARRLFGWRYDNKTVPLDSVDAALCHIGQPWMLRELYPELYQFDDEEQAA